MIRRTLARLTRRRRRTTWAPVPTYRPARTRATF